MCIRDRLSKTVLEFCYKGDELGDPMVNRYPVSYTHLA